MRVVKKAEERKNEILDAADELFALKGFDGTTTADIVEKVGIARGTLYYHFHSKEDIMEALIDRYSKNLSKQAKKAAAEKSGTIIERIFRVVHSHQLTGEGTTEIMAHIHKPENTRIHQEIEKQILREVTPLLTEIVRDGIAEGIFATPYPYEAMEMLLVYVNTIFDDNMKILSEKEQLNKVKAFIYNLERLLGAKSGSLQDVWQLFSK